MYGVKEGEQCPWCVRVGRERERERLAQFLWCVRCSGVSLSAGGGKYVRLRSLNLICDHPDHYKEWIEGVSLVCVCGWVGMGELGELRLDLHVLYGKQAPILCMHLGGEAGSDGNRIHIIAHDLLCMAHG